MTRKPTRGTVYAQVSRDRLLDADALVRARRYNGSVYLGGYAVECAFKAALCRAASDVYLDSALEVHDLDRLAGHGQGGPQALWSSLQRDKGLAEAFESVRDMWSVDMRYETKPISEAQAQRFLDMAIRLLAWLAALP